MNILFAAGPEAFVRLIVSIVVFMLVLAACYFTTVWIGNFQKGRIGIGNMEVIEVQRVRTTKYLEILRVGKHYYLLAVTKDHIEKIDEIDGAELVIPDSTTANMMEPFSQLFEKIKKRQTHDGE